MQKNAVFHYRLFILCFLGVALGALNAMLPAAYLPDIAREFTGSAADSATGQVGSWVNFAFMSGSTLGGILLGFASDRIGRRTVLMLAILFYSIGSGATTPDDTALYDRIGRQRAEEGYLTKSVLVK